MLSHPARLALYALSFSLLLFQPAPSSQAAITSIRVGAVFPLHSVGRLAQEEYWGVQIARDMVNAAGGVQGHRIVLNTRELDDPAQSRSVMDFLRTRGIDLVLGAYSSSLSIPAAQAAARDGMVYWEAGAVADRLTGQGLPTVFRVGASGSNLGMNSARFAAQQLAPRLHRPVSALRVSVVAANDDYANSVADAAIRQARSEGMTIVSRSSYQPYLPEWPPIMAAVRRAHPDILILASHIPDGISFRRAMLAAHIHVGAFIGSTMAECGPDFGAALGKDSVGVFASDRPMGGFNPAALRPAARALYNRLAVAWQKKTGERQPTEEGLAGFTAAWALFHDVLPRASQRVPGSPAGAPGAELRTRGSPTRAGFTGASIAAASIAAAARSLDLPTGSLPNGAGLRFAADRAHLGQNLRAAAVIWQWQAVLHSVVVWPADYATGHIHLVPLPR